MEAAAYAFLFTDIEGSTALLGAHGARYAELLEAHRRLLRGAARAHGGTEVSGDGDAMFFVFDAASDAIGAAFDGQRALAAHDWPEGGVVRVRAGVHHGEATPVGGEYIGLAVHAAWRIASAGHGGQVLVSGAARAHADGGLPPGASLAHLGGFRLRGVGAAEDVYELRHPHLPAGFPPLRSLEIAPHNLPEPMSPFVGRDAEIAAVRALVARDRLVTLTGSAGCGKTRLALRAAGELLETFPDGAWFADLAPLTDPALVTDEVARALGVQADAGTRVLDALVAAIAGRRMLLVLDNCEHLLDACAHLASHLLTTSQDLAILATSREALGVPGEGAWRVPSMSLPEPGAARALAEASDAVRLFVDRARAAVPGFEPTSDDLEAIATICARLDGLPLAIELAAARANVLTPQQIAARLDDMFRFLTGGSRTALERQQTMRAAVDWSHALLSEEERVLLRRVSVFVGGFTLEAAERVCAALPLDASDVLDLVSALVRRSLVVADRVGAAVRYRTLETIRQYARERLFESGEATDVRARHLAWCVALAEEAGERLGGADQARWLVRLDAEHDNLRAAIEWATSTDPEAGMRIASGVRWFWAVRAHWDEGRRLADALLAADGGDARVRSLAAEAAALQSLMELDAVDAASRYERLIVEARAVGDGELEVRALSGLAEALVFTARWDEASALVDEALALSERVGGNRQRAHLLSQKAGLARDVTVTRRLLEEALDLARRDADAHTTAVMLRELAAAEVLDLELDGTARHAEEGMALARAIGDRPQQAACLRLLSSVAYVRGDILVARDLRAEAGRVERDLGGRLRPAKTASSEAIVRELDGDLEGARAILEPAIRQMRDAGMTRWVLACLPGYAEICRRLGDRPAARAALIEATEGLRANGETTEAALEAIGLARVAREDGRLDEAAGILARVLDETRGVSRARWRVLEALEEAAQLLALARPADALTLLAAAAAVREALGTPTLPWLRDGIEAARAAARARLEPARADAAEEAGRAMSLDEASRRATEGLEALR